jgi:acyl-[acyl-carrier-protein]-phospholipid O-acyltransferase / long-chain-fatty-acid--[acyl-carrier-protein] ligase
VLGIFPEGFITTDGEVRRFQPGLSKIHKADPCTVLPVHLSGLWGSVFSYRGGRMFSKLLKSKYRGALPRGRDLVWEWV